MAMLATFSRAGHKVLHVYKAFAYVAHMSEVDVLVIGAGPAGLMAAEAAATAGAGVLVVDHMPSPARKFLMAGKSGLNLTKDEAPERFLAAYGNSPVVRYVAEFGPAEVKAWAEGLGQALFTGSTGRVFPVAMKASPLLRAWLGRLDRLGVVRRHRWRWLGGGLFETPAGRMRLAAKATVLACGGASWARLGSDGHWTEALSEGALAPFAPANGALCVDWSAHMVPHFGTPVKNTGLCAGEQNHRGEFVVTKNGLEGGGLYPLTPALRAGMPLVLDLKPDWSAERVAERLTTARGSLSNRLRKGLRLTPVQIALFMENARPVPPDPVRLIKSLPIRAVGVAPLDDAISTAGGLRFDALTPDLMLRSRPGVFACGEMLDWEAPTGGYLLTACLATGHAAGRAAGQWVRAEGAED